MISPSLWTTALLAALCWNGVAGFAYAPNFITKTIQEQTGIEPQGLLTISDATTAAPSEEEDDQTPESSVPSTTTATATKKVVTTRFPPEPNGYLHLGHAKAVSFNFAVARMFDGVCHMRMDDTNPSKEDEEYVQSILEDVKWIQQGLYQDDGDADSKPWEGPVRKTSQYFDTIYDCAVALIESGNAYVDSLSAEEMREYRGSLTEPGKDSPYRTRSVEENLELFQGMRNGDFAEGTHVLRAKIDMASPNINMRDPTLYRIKHESHQETGDTWCIYPMYDFSHPISDALEGITHSLCTLEFEDHRPFYDWTVQKLAPTGLIQDAQPQQIEFSRLNVKSTVLSKRKLIQLVTSQSVSGWDDPRMPTLSGLRRRGVPPAALRLFCERVGISKTDSNIDFSNLEDCVRETMDATSARAFCVLKPLLVTLSNWEQAELEDFEVDRHPKISEMGTRTIPFGKQVYIERSDFFDVEGPEGQAANGRPPKGFKRLLPDGGQVRLRYAYVIQCDEIIRDPDTQEPVELKCTYLPDTRAGVTPEGMPRVKGIIHWVEASTAVPCTINQYDRLFSTEEPGKESGDYLLDLNPNSLQVLDKSAVVEPSVAQDAKKKLEEIKSWSEESSGAKVYPSSLAYQFERSGYFAMDKDATEDSLVFNRVSTLRDTWGVVQKKPNGEQQPQQRNRGGGGRGQQQQAPPEPVEDLRRVALTASTILSVEPHPEADSLLVCQVDCGDKDEEGQVQPRTVVAGLAGKIPSEDLIGQKVVTVTNLKPAKMRGILSNAMLLAASDSSADNDNEKVELLSVPESVPNGELLQFEGKEPSQPDAMLKSKGALKAWDRVKACLQASKDGDAMYVDAENKEEAFRLTSSGGPIKTETLKEAVIQ
uniref:glutamine--tRNA ligase n=1 Tax=Entomoneis paludosa TaxID=265537 RepID=A0A7S3DN67_9STRA|mmetsp:Transcript_22652/g.47242  ORF Transcript_22652/g.47242 Transcript_22652/m.47242 type:complete len:877 (+) Transcript_22652:187-2817(+)|eukprot:CAMPEP_0172474500 /NCGR_PEP_ID=MMETSP1065-20121228/69390_1 /TAXON_ID=265537 /ORGANISM="Amphiprora paludosa, Strain CCMP125" /LENGTH=876 /DNA_ID=CAMNT_0013232683 /DNA_START=132 /DNA_END=2762 /DNA_ORIENTATION=+